MLGVTSDEWAPNRNRVLMGKCYKTKSESCDLLKKNNQIGGKMRIQLNQWMVPGSAKMWKKTNDKKAINHSHPFAQTMSFKKENSENSFWLPQVPAAEENSMYSQLTKSMKDDYKTKKVLKKIARGEQLNEEEMAHLAKIAPEEIQKAKAASQRRKEIERQVAAAKTKDEAEKILLIAKQEAIVAANSKYSQAYGEYLMEAVSKVEEKYRQGKSLGGEEPESSTGLDIRV